MKKSVFLFVAIIMLAIPHHIQAGSWPMNVVQSEAIQQSGFRISLMGSIGDIDNVKLVMRGTTGTLTYTMGKKRIVSKLVVDSSASDFDKDGYGHVVLKSYTPQGKLKGTFIGDSDVAECGFIYEGNFVNVNGSSTEFLFCE